MPADPRDRDSDRITTDIRRSLITSALTRLSLLAGITTAGLCGLGYLAVDRYLHQNLANRLSHRLDSHLSTENNWLELVVSKHRQLAAEYLAQYRRINESPAAAQEALRTFDFWMQPAPGGRWIVKPDHFAPAQGGFAAPSSPRDMSGAIDNAAPLSDDAKRRHALGLDLVWKHGPGFVRHPHHPTNTPVLDLYYQGPEESLLIHWPKTLWNPLDTPGFKFPGHAYFDYGLPSFNPTRETKWTGTFFDEVAGVWMASCITPVDFAGRHLGHFGCDIELAAMQTRIRDNTPGGGDILIFSRDGKLIAHSSLDLAKHGATGFFIERDGDRALKSLYALANTGDDHRLIEDAAGDRVIVAGSLPATGWKIVLTQANATHRADSLSAALAIAAAGLVLLAIEVALIHRILRREIIRPLHRLSDATRLLAEDRHDDAKSLLADSNRTDELGRLSDDFLHMADTVRESRARLEDRVRARTLELETAKNQAEEANRAKSRFLSAMTHELRTPLNAILGFAQLLRRDPATPASHRENLGVILKSGDHLLTLINRVLDLAKIESGKTTREPEEFDLGGMLDEITDQMRSRAKSKGIRFDFDPSSSFPRFVKTDREKLRQVLLNLVGNAVKYTDRGGVTLKTTLMSLAAQAGGMTLRFEIADTGPGIAAADLDRIFRPFEQLDAQSGGTGLGLTLSREFVRLLGGSLEVDSKPGQGSVFSFTIIAEPVEESHWADIPILGAGPLPTIENAAAFRVLIVEDHPANRMVLHRLLAPHGFLLREAADGRRGVEIAHEWNPHLILMDRRMPELDGLRATRAIRALDRHPRPVIIAVTAHASMEERAEMINGGCDDLLPKPFRADRLFELLAKHLRLKLMRKESDTTPPDSAAPDADAARAVLRALPAPCLAEIQKACAAADSERIIELLAPYPEASTALAPYLKTFRLDQLAALISD